MPISRHLQGLILDPEAITVAYEKACVNLQLVDRDAPVTELVAKEVIAVAQSGERDPLRITQTVMQKYVVRRTK
jgi:hypothetical protein